MAKYNTLTALFTAIANSLRGKTGGSGKIVADDFPSVIDGLSTGGITPTGTKTITANGSHDVTTFATAQVNVPVPDGYIKPSGTKTITTNGTHDVTSYANASVNVPVPDGYIKPSGTKNITSNGTHDVTSYASAQVNVPVPNGYIKPSGTKSITTNGTHDVTNFASAQVNVPVGITPSGSKTITENGTYDVTNFASALVNVPIPAQKLYTFPITVSSDLGAGTNKEQTVLSANDFVKAHYADENFFALWYSMDATTAAASTVVGMVYHGNRAMIKAKSTAYGFFIRSTGEMANAAMMANTAKLGGKGYNVSLRAESSGDINLYVASAYTVPAGNYLLVLGLMG